MISKLQYFLKLLWFKFFIFFSQVKSSRPTIKRKRTTSTLQTSAYQPKKISSTFENDIQSVVPEKAKKATSEKNILCKKEDFGKLVPNKEKLTPKSLVDNIDSFLLNGANVTLDYMPDASVEESDEMVLEIEQLFRKMSL